jgi:hypothetical protein
MHVIDISGFVGLARNIPQGLKPDVFGEFIGAAEAAPFQGGIVSSVRRWSGYLRYWMRGLGL